MSLVRLAFDARAEFLRRAPISGIAVQSILSNARAARSFPDHALVEAANAILA